eukprot:m.92588 g.92588  ORF g.92588 m.92588 type:complete len:258 (+) comp36743_c0_seq6:558-1331(+)
MSDKPTCFHLQLKTPGFHLGPQNLLASFSVCFEPKKRSYLLAMCSQPITPQIWKDIPEWIDYHHKVGIEHFYLYAVNNTRDELAVFLKRYIDENIVSVQSWMSHSWIGDEVHVRQITAQNDCIYRHRDESKWIGFFDVDEYLYSEKGIGLHDLVQSYENQVASALQFKSVFFQRDESPGKLVIENYWRADSVLEDKRQKYFCRPNYTKITSVHLTTLGEKMIILDSSVLRINHYRSGFRVSNKVQDYGMKKYVEFDK